LSQSQLKVKLGIVELGIMDRHTVRTGAFVALLLSIAALNVLAQAKPLLSEEVRTAWERDGIQAAQRRFNEIVPGQTDAYELDMEGFAELAREGMQSGDAESMQAFSIMMSTLAMQMMGMTPGAGPGGIPGMPDMAAMQAQDEAIRQRRAEEREAEQAQAAVAAEEERAAWTLRVLGSPRDDLDRFVGQYGPPDKQETPRWNLFATVRCDGYLVVGAMAGDGSNWNMRSLSDLVFETEMFGGDTLTISFAVDPSGSPVSMTHTLKNFGSELLPYLGSLPAEWSASGCIPP
jgi:hypothetical protein